MPMFENASTPPDLELAALSPEQQSEIAASLDADVELLPYLPALLADLESLGSSPLHIVELLRPYARRAGSTPTTVLDLACGMGAVAIALARELGARVHGVDLFPSFVAEARRRAEAAGVGTLCSFESIDLRVAMARSVRWDVVIYAATGVLGELHHAIGALRRVVRPDGLIVIDDGFLSDGERSGHAGFEHYAPHGESTRRLRAHGDDVLREVVIPVEEQSRRDQRYAEQIRSRAEELCVRFPGAASSFRAYVERQESENSALEAEIVGALWLLRRGAP